tara:strand:- start:515 stop:661 length:147 start_codon:yes stop_codon:yes gene_type:complete
MASINKRKRTSNNSTNRATGAGNKTEQYKVDPNTGTKPAKPKSYVSNK